MPHSRAEDLWQMPRPAVVGGGAGGWDVLELIEPLFWKTFNISTFFLDFVTHLLLDLVLSV